MALLFCFKKKRERKRRRKKERKKEKRKKEREKNKKEKAKKRRRRKEEKRERKEKKSRLKNEGKSPKKKRKKEKIEKDVAYLSVFAAQAPILGHFWAGPCLILRNRLNCAWRMRLLLEWTGFNLGFSGLSAELPSIGQQN